MAGTGKSKYLEPLKKILDGLSNETFVFFDTETTGLDQHDDQITEIAAVAVRGPDFEEIDSMEAKASLNDDTLRRIEEQKAGVGLPKDKRHKTVAEILEMNRYYDGESKGRPENDILIEFKDFCEKYNPVLVGHNPEFDLRMVGTKVGRIPNRGVWDTMLFARFFFHPMLLALEETGDPEAAKILSGIRGSKGTPHATLGKVLQALGQSIEGWHTALADVRSTVKAFRGIMDYVRAHLDLASTEAYGRHQSRAFKVVRDYKRGLVDRGENPGKI
jgi:DNA polymerase III epsilon subunit-like protein